MPAVLRGRRRRGLAGYLAGVLASARSGPEGAVLRGAALPLDERGQIPGQLDVYDALRALPGPSEMVPAGVVPERAERVALLTANKRSESERSDLVGRVGARGVDTIAYGFRPGWPGFWDRLLMRPFKSVWRHGVQELSFERGPSGADLRAYPGAGLTLLKVECRLDALIEQTRDTFRLCPVHDVARGEIAARQEFEALAGVPMDGGGEYCIDAQLPRFDLTSEVEFDEPSDGLAFLATIAALSPSRRKAQPVRADDGRVETVVFRTPKRFVVRERVYDKGVESGSHPAGLRVRLESQNREPRSRQPPARAFGRLDHGAVFGRSFESYAHHETVATGAAAAVADLLGRVQRGELSMTRARGMVGDLTILGAFGRGVYADSTGRRRLAELRKNGVTPEAVLPVDRVVPVGRLLRESIDAWSKS